MTVWSQVLLVVADVPRSSRFYAGLLGLESGHGGDEYEQLYHDGELIMQLHNQEADEAHGPLADLEVPVGNGVLVWFEVADFGAAVAQARALGAPIIREVAVNPDAKHQELWLADPDGYTVVLAGPSEYRPR